MQNWPPLKTCDIRLRYMHFYQSWGYIYISVVWRNLWYFMISQVFTGVVFYRLSQYITIDIRMIYRQINYQVFATHIHYKVSLFSWHRYCYQILDGHLCTSWSSISYLKLIFILNSLCNSYSPVERFLKF